MYIRIDCNEEIEICPCCKGEAVATKRIRSHFDFHAIMCSKCGMRTKDYPKLEQAIENWNARETEKRIVDISKGCATCKNTRLDADEEPCIGCRYSGQAPEGEDCWEPQSPPTNAERIRMMSDEELAEIIMCPRELGEDIDVLECRDRDCNKCCLEYLQKRADKGEK